MICCLWILGEKLVFMRNIDYYCLLLTFAKDGGIMCLLTI